ncbi:MAG TPA: NCS2 family permease [Thermoanaerobaculia bacterium]|jgi:AGZA family xanthine/uracil permease-like MFS transporter|nr:NCS2 family permease [Thermoanaerobaculia bacterium]
MGSTLERLFALRERETTVATEVRAGLVTFLTMAYILLVNPQVLAAAGMPKEDVVFATAVGSAVGTLAMALLANYPFALAPGMGINAYFAYSVCGAMGVSWRVALTAVFVSGLLFMALSAGGIRTLLLRAIPTNIKLATSGGIGLFLALIGFENAGLVKKHPATLLTLGDVRSAPVLLALGALVLMAVLLALRVRAALLLGIAAATAAAWLLGIAPPPTAVVALPALPRQTLLAFDWHGMASGTLATVVLAFLFVVLFDTTGTLMGVGRLGGFVDEEGNLPRAGRAFFADAFGTTAGAALGTSPVTAYIESATGIEEGGRTGLTGVVVALLFLASLVLAPLFTAVPPLATAPALVVVGALMIEGMQGIDWKRFDEAIPAFLTIVGMPFTYSIANGIALGIVSWVIIKLLAGRWREAHPLMIVLAALLVLYYAFLYAG